MKLWTQGLILIGLPLGLQIALAVALITSLHRINTAASQETTSKQILSTCQDVRTIVDRFIVVQLARRYVPPKLTQEQHTSTAKELSQKLKQLDSLSGLDQESKEIVQEFSKHATDLLGIMSAAETDFSGVEPKVALSRFIDEREWYEEVMLAMRNLMVDDRKIQKHFSPIAKEFSPKSLENNQYLLTIVIAGIICSIMLAAVLAFFYGKWTLARIGLLLQNIKSFSEGSKSLETLSGNDELAVLGQSFREMADARIKSEELRATMLDMVSHDLRSPLSSCNIALITILERDTASLTSPVLRSLKRVTADLERLVRMADTLLTIGKLEHDSIELSIADVSPDDVVGPTLSAVRGIADVKGIGFEIETGEDIVIACDADRVIQILVNLISNSIKFAPKDSTITIRVTRSEHDSRFEILDEGPGVPEEQQGQLFQKYFQLDQPSDTKKAGAGLGLYISKMLVSAHHGEIGCTTPAEGGACFWFTIPDPKLSTTDTDQS